MGKQQLVISGSIAVDRIMNFTAEYGELLRGSNLDVVSVSVLVDSLALANGGTGANIAHSLASLGEKPVLLGSVGNDAEGYIKELAATGVDTSNVHYSQLPTASFNVLTDASGNQVGGFYPGAMSEASGLSLQPFKNSETLVCVSANGPEAMRRHTDECKEYGLRLMYDPGQQVSNVVAADLKAGVEAAEIVIVNSFEHDMLLKKCGLTPDELASLTPILIVTHGDKGSEIRGNKVPSPIIIPVAAPSKIVDPTGAGDAYRAGFLYGYVREMELSACGRIGAVVASYVLEQSGPQAEINLDLIKDRYKQTFNEEVEL